MVLSASLPSVPYAAAPLALWVVPVAELGGVARHVLDVARSGIPGWRLAVLCPPGPLADALVAAGAAVTTGAVGPEVGTGASVRTVRATVRALRPAVVHSHLAHADVVVSAATWGLPVRLVSTEHGIAGDDLVYHGTARRSAARAAMHTARLRRLDALVAVSRSTADTVRAKWHPPASLPLHVVLNGVDRLPQPPHRGPGLHVASVARLATEKRIDALLRAVAVLRRSQPDVRLTVAGAGPLEHALRTLTRELGLDDVVDMVGHVDAGELLERCDVVAQLSTWENCSYTLLDALVRGCGVVATAVGGNPEILPPDDLVPAEPPEVVAAALERSGLQPRSRPALPATWPSVAQMCAQLAEVYAGLGVSGAPSAHRVQG